MAWVHAIGVYLLAGTIFQGLGWIARAGWVAAGKAKPTQGRHAKLLLGIGMALGVLFWPVFLVVITIYWRRGRRTRKMERFLGFCEHATALDPYCDPCRRDLKREEKERKTSVVSSVSIQDIAIRMDRLSRKTVETYIQAHPACPKCGKTGTLDQYLDSIWVKCLSCGRRTFTPDPSMPEEVDMVPGWSVQGPMLEAASSYECFVCGTRSEGFPPGADVEGHPLCVPCKIAHLRTQK